jgi:hypothetical protein
LLRKIVVLAVIALVLWVLVQKFGTYLDSIDDWLRSTFSWMFPEGSVRSGYLSVIAVNLATAF